MPAAVIGESAVLTPVSDSELNKAPSQTEVDFVKCSCCGLSEECTLPYIEAVRQRYGGKWICGLCAEAVKDEASRCEKLISPDEAMARHVSFCSKVQASKPPQDPGIHLIRAMSHVLRKSLESPRSLRSMPNSPRALRSPNSPDASRRGKIELKRTESCISSLRSLVDLDSSVCSRKERNNEDDEVGKVSSF